MRPVIVKSLNEYFNTGIFDWLVPELALIYSAAIVVCGLVFVKRSKNAGLSEYHALGAALWASLAGLIGVRLWYLLMNFDMVIRQPSMLWDFKGSTVSFGGYLFGGIAFVLYLVIKKLNPFVYLDVAGSCLGLGPMIARWACFLNGDDYGTISNVPWAVKYPPGSYPFADHINNGLINVMADYSLPVHAVQVYLSIKGLLLFIICSYLWKKFNFRPGILFGIFWLLYAVLRFSIEFYRGDDTVDFVGHFTHGQVICFMIFIISTIYIFILSTKTATVEV